MTHADLCVILESVSYLTEVSCLKEEPLITDEIRRVAKRIQIFHTKESVI